MAVCPCCAITLLFSWKMVFQEEKEKFTTVECGPFFKILKCSAWIISFAPFRAAGEVDTSLCCALNWRALVTLPFPIGPLVYTDSTSHITLIGVTSFGFGCGDPQFPGVYARAVKASDWIRQVISNSQCQRTKWTHAGVKPPTIFIPRRGGT